MSYDLLLWLFQTLTNKFSTVCRWNKPDGGTAKWVNPEHSYWPVNVTFRLSVMQRSAETRARPPVWGLGWRGDVCHVSTACRCECQVAALQWKETLKWDAWSSRSRVRLRNLSAPPAAAWIFIYCEVPVLWVARAARCGFQKGLDGDVMYWEDEACDLHFISCSKRELQTKSNEKDPLFSRETSENTGPFQSCSSSSQAAQLSLGGRVLLTPPLEDKQEVLARVSGSGCFLAALLLASWAWSGVWSFFN